MPSSCLPVTSFFHRACVHCSSSTTSSCASVQLSATQCDPVQRPPLLLLLLQAGNLRMQGMMQSPTMNEQRQCDSVSFVGNAHAILK